MHLGYKSVAPHRFVYELVYGEICNGRHVAHTCDNPICCNPFHLKQITAFENHDDAVKKGRKKPGERKLSDDDVLEIKAKYDGTMKCCRDLAEEYDVHSGWIYRIVKYGAR